MYLEAVGLIGLFLLILFSFSEFFKRKEIGLIASLLLIVLGLLILTSGIQIITGTLTYQTIGMI